jgi:uncharacterized membrane protein
MKDGDDAMRVGRCAFTRSASSPTLAPHPMKTLVILILALSCSACTVLSVAGTAVSTTVSVAGTVIGTGVSVAGSAVRGVANAASGSGENN